MLRSTLVAVALTFSHVEGVTYRLVETNHGLTFFNNFDFYDQYDNLTSGDVVYVNSSHTPPLAYINDAGNAIVKVDTGKVIYNQKRSSVRITQKSSYDVGTVWVFDAVHVPYGCSTWPAYWTRSPLWPVGGEQDIFEAIHLSAAQYALHGEAGCAPNNTPAQMTGEIGVKNCNTSAGCTVGERSPRASGEAFARNGGGVWVSELATSGVSIWFIERQNVPTWLTAEARSIDPSALGVPSAYWPAQGRAPISHYLHTQQAVINIALCGVWAGTADTLRSSGCTVPVAPETCYTTHVLNGDAAFDTAFFEIRYLNVYSSDPLATSVPTHPTSTATRSFHPSATGTLTGTSSVPTSAGSGDRRSVAWTVSLGACVLSGVLCSIA